MAVMAMANQTNTVTASPGSVRPKCKVSSGPAAAANPSTTG